MSSNRQKRKRTQESDDNDPSYKFSLTSLVANILNPIPMTNAVLNVMKNEDEVEEFQAEICLLKEHITSLESYIYSLENQLSASQEQYRACQHEVVLRNQTITQLQERLDVIQQENDSLERNNQHLGLEYKQQVIILENQVEESQESLSLTREKLNEYRHKYQNTVDIVTEMGTESIEDKQRITEMTARENDQNLEIACLTYKLNKLQNELNEKTYYLTHAEDSLQVLSCRYDSMQNKLEMKENQLYLNKSIIGEYKVKNKLLHLEVVLSDKKMHEYYEKYTLYRELHSHPNADFEELYKHISTLEYQLEDTRAEMASTKRRIQYELSKTHFRKLVPAISSPY